MTTLTLFHPAIFPNLLINVPNNPIFSDFIRETQINLKLMYNTVCNQSYFDVKSLVTDSHLFGVDVNIEVRNILRIDHAFQCGFDKRVPTADRGVTDISG